MTAPATLPPEQNIGPYYRAIGAVLLFLFAFIVVGLVWPLVTRGTAPSDFVVKVLAGLAGVDLIGFFLVVLRPARFDSVFRLIIAAIPWTKYQGAPSAPPTGGAP